ncbi:MAG: hypothetical protein WBN09_15525 [Woeseiaceae bacterium]
MEAHDLDRDVASIAAIASSNDWRRMPELLVDACESLVPADSSLLAVFGDTAKPSCIYHDVPLDQQCKNIDAYLEGNYLLDPYYRAGIERVASGVYPLDELAPPGFNRSDYFQRYYKDAGIGDEIGIIVHLPDDCFAILSLATEAGSAEFSPADIRRLEEHLPDIEAVIVAYWNKLRSA